MHTCAVGHVGVESASKVTIFLSGSTGVITNYVSCSCHQCSKEIINVSRREVGCGVNKVLCC